MSVTLSPSHCPHAYQKRGFAYRYYKKIRMLAQSGIDILHTEPMKVFVLPPHDAESNVSPACTMEYNSVSLIVPPCVQHA